MLLRGIYALLLPLIWLAACTTALISPKMRAGMRGRRAAWSTLRDAAGRRDMAKPLVWLHCASAGEFLQAEPVLRRLRAGGAQVAVSLSSASGLPWLERVAHWPELVWGGLLPLDFPWNTRHMLDTLRPSAIVYVQADFWAGLLWAAQARGIPQALIAARTGKGGNYRAHPLLRPVFKKLYGAMAAIECLTEQDREGIAAILGDGAGHARLAVLPRLEVAGDPGIETVLARLEESPLPEALRNWAGTNAPMLVAGSTWPADEQALLPALAAAFARHPRMRAVIAPHEPTEAALAALEAALTTSRAGTVIQEGREDAPGGNLDTVRLSALIGKGRAGKREAGEDRAGIVGAADGEEAGGGETGARVLLVDEVGRLATIYSLATVAYVGGGFTSGVHNMAEPAAWGAPVLCGPLHRNSAIAGLLLEAGAAQAIDNPEDLGAALLGWLEDDARRAELGAKARAIVQAQAGAAQRCFEAIVRIVPGLSGR